MKKILITIAGIFVAILVLLFGWLTYSTQKNLAAPTEQALAALESTSAVSVSQQGDWLIMRPADGAATMGMILYPGANCDIRGYAAVMRAVAAAGYLVVGVSMPFDFAIFAPDSADDVRDAFPEIGKWVIAGHSMGGAMAGYYAFNHQDDLAGLILWDSYPPEANSLAGSTLPVVHIHRATLAGEPPQKFIDMQHVYPSSSVWVPIPGGIHMYFGYFDGGGYEEEWTPKISAEAQQEIVIAATVEALGKFQ